MSLNGHVRKKKLYMGFLCENNHPDIRVGRRSVNMETAINAVKRKKKQGYVREYNSGRVVWDNVLGLEPEEMTQ